MPKLGLTALCLAGACLFPRVASATKSAELYTSSPYGYGRFEARVRFTAGDGVVSAFFLWKDGSEQPGTFWNELDYEKIGADCKLQTNALYGNPSASHTQQPTVSTDLCSSFHVYAYEWTADYIAWSLDGTEVRRETGDIAAAYAQNATAGMAVHFNLWPGDATFGGNFDPSILPVHQYVDWVQFSSYANGAFTLAWREDFDGSTLPSNWLTGNWGSPKNLSTHDPANVNFLNSCAVLSMTADAATGSTGADTTGCTPGTGSAGAGGTSAQGGMAGTTAGASAGGAGTAAGGSGGVNASGATGGANASGAAAGATGMTGSGGAGGSGAASSTGGSGAVAAGGSAGVSSAGTPGAPGVGGGVAGGPSSLGGSSTVDNSAGSGTESSAGHSAKDGDSSGCGCRVPASTPSSRSGGVAALVLALAGAFLRRRTSRPSRVR